MALPCPSFSAENARRSPRNANTVCFLPQEQETIRETLKNAKLPIRFRAMVATPSRVGEILNDGYQMIHYVGHGDGGRLSFESDDDRQCGIMETFEVPFSYC